MFMVGLLAVAGCQRDRGGEPIVVQLPGAAQPGDGQALLAASRTITVSGDAEIFTAPDRFEMVVAFDLQTDTLDKARDESRQRAAALLDVVTRHGIPACDVQTDQLSLQPRYDGNYGQAQRLIGYQASRSLTLTLHEIDKVEALLFDMLAAGANRIDRVSFHSSLLQEKRAEARVLAVKAAREKAAAMAAELGQAIAEPLRIDEGAAPSPWQAPPISNYVMNNDTPAHVGETMATGKISVHAGVSVVFRLQGA